MKKLAIAFVLLVVLAVGALLILPSFWDWNAEKGRMAALVKDHTGRDLEIAGNVSLRLLPTPAFAASDVTLTNLEGGSARAMMTLEELQVSVALLPLLRGEVRVESVTLVKPQVLLEVLPDGRVNWQFAADEGEAGADTPSAPGGEAPGAAAPRQSDQAIRVDSFLIEDGTVRYRDARSGREETISGLNAEFAAESLAGPFAANGAAVYHGVPLEFDVNIGQLVEAGATALSVSLKLLQAEADATFVGALSRHAELRTLRGRLQSQGDDLARVLRALAVATLDAPALLAQPFTVTAEISASNTDAAAEAVRLTLGTLSLDGRIAATLGEVPDVTATLSAKTVDLDELLALPEQGRAASAAGKAGAGEGPPVPSAAAPKAVPRTASAGIALPRGFTASLELGADALLYRGQTVRQLQVAARLEDGTLNLSRAAVQLPGSSEALLRGTLSTDAPGPRFHGTVEAKSDNLRGLLRWLGVDPAGVPAERLRRMVLKTGVEAGGSQLVLRNTNLTLDVSRLTGGAAIALRERPGLGIALSVDKVNLDAYLPVQAPQGAIAAPPVPAGDGTAVTAAPPQAPGAAAAEPLLGLPLLGRFDANLDLRVGQLTYRGLPLDGLHLDATLQRGGLVVREFSVADLAGSRGQFTGSLANVDHDASIDGSLDLSVSTLSRLVKALGLNAGGALPLESFTLSGAVNGNRQELRFDQSLAALGGSLRAAGKLVMTAAAPTVDSILTLDHPNLSVLLGELLRDADIPRGLGPATLKGRLLAAAPDYRLSGLEGTLAGAELLAGDIGLSLAGPRPKLTVDVSAGRLPLAAVAAPATGDTKGANPETKGASKTAAKSNGAAAGEERWSRQPIDLAVLRNLDAEVKLSAKALLAGKLNLTDARIEAVLAEGLLDLTRFTAAAYGGALSVTGQADARETSGPGLALTTSIAASDVELKGFLGDLADTDRFSGPLTLKGEFTTRGVSEAALVSALAGRGTLVGSVTAAAKVEEQAGALVLGILGKKVKEIRGVTDSTTMLFSAFAGAPAAIDGSFAVGKGVVRSDDLTVRGRDAVALTQGSADLPDWLIDSRTDVFRDADPKNAYLTAKLKGPLDEPNVTISGQPFQHSERPAAEQPAGAEPASEQPATTPLKPEEILKKGVKDLLKGLGG